MIRNTQESFDAKAKGEKFQKDLVALIKEILPEHKDVIVSSPALTYISYISYTGKAPRQW